MYAPCKSSVVLGLLWRNACHKCTLVCLYMPALCIKWEYSLYFVIPMLTWACRPSRMNCLNSIRPMASIHAWIVNRHEWTGSISCKSFATSQSDSGFSEIITWAQTHARQWRHTRRPTSATHDVANNQLWGEEEKTSVYCRVFKAIKPNTIDAQNYSLIVFFRMALLWFYEF